MFKKVFVFLILTVAVLVFPKKALGFGITPAEINVQDIKPGGHYENLIYLTRPVSEDNENLKVILEPALGDMDSWFTYSSGKEFTFPSGKNTTSFKVVVDVPADAQLKNFKGQITAKGMPNEKAGEGVTIIKGAVLGVNITTSNAETFDLNVLSITAPDVNSGDPVRLLLNIKNSGNTAAAPDEVRLDIMDLFEKPIESLSDSRLDKIDPFATKEIQAVFNSNLEKGQYRIDASVIFQGKEIARKKMILTVNAKPSKVTQENVPSRAGVFVPRFTFAAVLIVIGLILITLILLLYLQRERRDEESRLEKELVRLVHRNKILTWCLLIAGIVLIAAGVYQYLYLLGGNQSMQSGPVSEEMKTTVTPTSAQEKQKVSTGSSNVKGVSTEAQVTQVPFIVSKPGSPGKYPVYSEPSFTSEIIYEAENGETFTVVQQYGDWYKVSLQNNDSGWLHRSSIKKIN
jgi:hypothetical protein